MDQDLLPTQRALRHRLFEGRQALCWRPGRELAAQLLLYLDEPAQCWRLATAWLRATLEADRADGGFGGFLVPGAGDESRTYRVAAEARREAMALPSVEGVHFDAADPGVRLVWAQAAGFAMVDEVAQARGFSAPMRHTLASLGTGAKLALALRDGAQPVGLMCADWQRARPRLEPGTCDELTRFAREGLGPVLGAVARLARAAKPPRELELQPTPTAGLTPAERRVAELAATGLSYKDIARQLGRSVATVDHQLRQVRRKLGLRRSASLAHHFRA